MVMLAGTIRRVDMCQPAWSTKEDGVGGGCDGRSDLREVQASVLQVGRLTVLRTDRSEDVGGSSPLVTRCDGAGAALGVILFFWPMQNFQVRSLDFNFDQIRASVL